MFDNRWVAITLVLNRNLYRGSHQGCHTFEATTPYSDTSTTTWDVTSPPQVPISQWTTPHPVVLYPQCPDVLPTKDGVFAHSYFGISGMYS